MSRVHGSSPVTFTPVLANINPRVFGLKGQTDGSLSFYLVAVPQEILETAASPGKIAPPKPNIYISLRDERAELG